MKIKFSACRLVAAILIASASAQVASHAPTGVAKEVSLRSGKPVVRVNGVVMTDRDLLREMYTIFPYARQHNGFPKEMEADIRKGALQMIVFEELVYQQAKRQKTTVPASNMEHALYTFRKQFSSRAEYQEYLKNEAQGSEQIVKDRIQRSLVIESYLKTEVKDRSAVSLAEEKAFYEKNQARFAYKESFVFQSISVMPPTNANADVMKEARKKADESLRQAKATKSYQEFGLLAEKISEDDFHVNMGDHKAVERDRLPAAIVKTALAMQPGQVSDVIQLDNTFTIFRLNGHIPAGTRKFDEVKGQLRTEMQKEKEDRLRTALDMRLRKAARVEEL